MRLHLSGEHSFISFIIRIRREKRSVCRQCNCRKCRTWPVDPQSAYKFRSHVLAIGCASAVSTNQKLPAVFSYSQQSDPLPQEERGCIAPQHQKSAQHVRNALLRWFGGCRPSCPSSPFVTSFATYLVWEVQSRRPSLHRLHRPLPTRGYRARGA